ncbi:hypothetical protein D915_010998 [Fasciola hepatica]|uniref:Uncharacterized protein n=1 Tax=Fasciola hepatica TaxID=6192 RepID=A0A4E0QTG2_FASHE|nr:hypothetical protein D915_010998 [Fasciola hepatica]
MESCIPAFAQLVRLVEQSKPWSGAVVGRDGPEHGDDEMQLSISETDALTGTCVQSIVRNALYALRTPTFGVNFLAQALTESIETRLHFAFSVLILLARSQMSPIIPDCALENCADATILGSDLITRLDQLIRSLRVIRWLGRTRMPALPDSRRLYVIIPNNDATLSICDCLCCTVSNHLKNCGSQSKQRGVNDKG